MHELRTVIPGRGQVTLYRGKTHNKIKSYQRHNDLHLFEGVKVFAVEVYAEVTDKRLGWVYEASPIHEVPYVH